MGKAKFLFLRGDRGVMLQLYLRADNAEAFAVSEKLQLGDLVWARGPLFQNNLTMFFTSLGLEEMETVEQAAAKLTGQHASFLKDKLGDAFRDLMWLMRPMPPGLHMKFILWQMKGQFSSFYHSHTGVFAPELEVFAGARVESAYHIPGFSSPPGTGVFANEKNGRLILTFAWREGVLTKDEQDAMVEQVLKDLGAA